MGLLIIVSALANKNLVGFPNLGFIVITSCDLYAGFIIVFLAEAVKGGFHQLEPQIISQNQEVDTVTNANDHLRLLHIRSGPLT